MKIIVIGATGMLGRPVTKKLIEAGYEVTIGSRDPAKVRGFDQAKKVRADLFDPASLREAFRGQDALYLNLSVNRGAGRAGPHQETDGLRNAIEAARAEGVKRIGFISSLVKNYQGMDGFSWWEFDVKNEAVRILRESGLPHLIFYPSSFMENFTGEQLSGKKILIPGKSRQKMWFIAGDDYGEMVAKAFALPEGESREYPVQGLEPFTYEEAAEVFVENYPGELRISRPPVWPLRLAGLVSPKMRDLWSIVYALNHYPEKFESEETWKELGKPKITLAEFAKEA